MLINKNIGVYVTLQCIN